MQSVRKFAKREVSRQVLCLCLSCIFIFLRFYLHAGRRLNRFYLYLLPKYLIDISEPYWRASGVSCARFGERPISLPGIGAQIWRDSAPLKGD